MRRLLVICIAALVLAALASRSARAQTEAYCNVTRVTSVQLKNAVRITLEADGTLAANIRKWYWGNQTSPDRLYYVNMDLVSAKYSNYTNWPAEVYPQVDRILVHLDNALPQVGNVINVGLYPVSHVRLVMAPEANARYGLDVEVVLQKKMRIRAYRFGQTSMWDAYLLDHRDPAWFEMVLSPDSRSLIITVASDRLPETRDHRQLADTPATARELRVNFGDGQLSVHARNAALGEVADAVSRQTGLHFAAVGAAADRVITAELPSVTPSEFAARIADCYGLVLTGDAGRQVFSDAFGQDTASQAPIIETRLPVQHLKAAQALNLLPSFLLDFIRVDDARNALMVAGPASLAGKVAADLAKIDQPGVNVQVRARVIETTSAQDSLRQIALRAASASHRATTDPETGQITYATLGTLSPGFEAELTGLLGKGGAKLRADSSIVVTSGETGEIFSGQDKYVLVFVQLTDVIPSALPISAGVKLTVTPRAGERHLSLMVATEVTSIDQIDPVSRLPVVATRRTAGAFCLQPGETVAIGGLSRRQETWVRRKLPLLGDLPLVGRLFRTKRRQVSNSELLVLLTPTVVEASKPRAVEAPERPAARGPEPTRGDGPAPALSPRERTW